MPQGEKPVTLDASLAPEHREPTSDQRRGLTRRAAVLGTALGVLTSGSLLTWVLTRDDDVARGGAGGSGAGNTPITVVIGVDAPLTGEMSSMGLGIRNSADLAVRTANESRHVPGVTFEIKALDDAADAAEGASNATRFVADEKVLGVVGPLNSSVARTLVPPLARAGVVTVSPGNTDPTLTLGPDWATGHTSRPHSTYFRTIATDVDQGPFAARYLYEAKKTRLYVIDDTSTHGTTLTAGFTDTFTELGGTVVGTEQVDPAERAFAGLAVRVRASGADAVYFGGYYDAAAPLSRQLEQAGVNVPLMGGDGIFDLRYPTENPEAEGDLATQIGVPAEESEAGQAFLARYRTANYPEPPGWYGPYAYDATWALVEAVKTVVTADGGRLPADAREKLARAVAGTAFEGVTGRVAFDGRGDTITRRLTAYVVDDGSWKVAPNGATPDPRRAEWRHPESRRTPSRPRGARLRAMERAEVLKRVIGILTEAQEIRRAVEEESDGEEDFEAASEVEPRVVTQMLNEMLPHISVPADAAPQEVAHLLAAALGPALYTMVSGFTLAFTSLAVAHDEGRSDISSAEVLQSLALQVEAGRFDEGA